MINLIDKSNILLINANIDSDENNKISDDWINEITNFIYEEENTYSCSV